MIYTEFRPKQRKNEIRFRYSVIASFEGRPLSAKKGRGLRAGWLSLSYQERNLVVLKSRELISKSQEKARL